MRPPNRRLSNNGSGVDSITVFSLGIDNVANTDEQGNWIRQPVAGTTLRAIVTPSFATGVDADGSQLSMTTYQVMLYTNTRPFPLTDSPVEWKKNGVPKGTLVALGEAAPSGPGCWAFQASEAGPNPDASSGLPEGV